jgi:hypothetical protein
MFSALSSGVKNAPLFNQAARNAACMAEVLRREHQSPADLRHVGFYRTVRERVPSMPHVLVVALLVVFSNLYSAFATPVPKQPQVLRSEPATANAPTDFRLINQLPRRMTVLKEDYHAFADKGSTWEILEALIKLNDGIKQIILELVQKYYKDPTEASGEVRKYFGDLTTLVTDEQFLDNPTADRRGSSGKLDLPIAIGDRLTAKVASIVKTITRNAPEFDFLDWQKRWEAAVITGDRVSVNQLRAPAPTPGLAPAVVEPVAKSAPSATPPARSASLPISPSPPPATAGPTRTGTLAPSEAERVIAGRSRDALLALKSGDTVALSRFAHPAKGIRFSPDVSIQKGDRVLTARDVAALKSDRAIRMWGEADAGAGPIKLSWTDYRKSFVYSRDFAAATEIRYNTFALHPGGNINHLDEAFPGAIFVEYFVPGTPDVGGLNWKGLWLIWEQSGNAWYLVGIAHAAWGP